MARILFCAKTALHRPYWISVLTTLAGRGHEMLLTYGDGAAGLESSNEGFTIMPFPVKALSRIDHLMRETRTAISYRQRKGQSSYYFRRWAGNLPSPLSRLVMNSRSGEALVRLRVDTLLGKLISRKPANRAVKKALQDAEPDFVLASPANHWGSLDIECVKAARELSIPCAIVTLSWDNLSTKGLFHATPDILFVWNAAHAKEAEAIHGIPPSNIVVSGAPFFEKWLAPAAQTGEAKGFLARIGLKPGSRYVLYVGSTRRTARDESWLVRDMEDILGNSPKLRDLSLVVRPHPANVEPFRDACSDRVIVWPREGVLPSGHEDVEEFRIMLENASAVVGINTSAMIDAVTLNVPTVAFLADRYARTQVRAVHFKRLMNSGAVGLVDNKDALAGMLTYVSRRRDWREEERQEFVDKYIAPHGRDYPPSAHIADCIERRLGHPSTTGVDPA
ncbi:MAG: CDP-glycerol glycerophosphotransferase family protein [Arenicellales bacterium]